MEHSGRTESQTKPNYFLIWNNGTYGGKLKTMSAVVTDVCRDLSMHMTFSVILLTLGMMQSCCFVVPFLCTKNTLSLYISVEVNVKYVKFELL
jgi:hypothetical protein